MTGSVQARTPGAPSTATMQFGHWPAQHNSPRRRWYLKLRENVRRPAAYSADPIVSPSYASTALPSNVNRITLPRSIRSPGWLRQPAHAAPPPPGSAGSSVSRTSLVRVSRSAMNQARQPER